MIHIKLTDAISFKELASKAQTDEEMDFVRKIILDSGADPNEYLGRRKVLTPDNLVQQQTVE